MAAVKIPILIRLEAQNLVFRYGAKAKQIIIDEIVKDAKDGQDRKTLAEYEMLYDAVEKEIETMNRKDG